MRQEQGHGGHPYPQPRGCCPSKSAIICHSYPPSLDTRKLTLNKYSTALSGLLKLALSARMTRSRSKPISTIPLIACCNCAPETARQRLLAMMSSVSAGKRANASLTR